MEKTYLINTLFFKGGILMQNVMKKILCTGLALLLVCPNNIAQASSVSIEENQTVSFPNEVMQSDAVFFEKKDIHNLDAGNICEDKKIQEKINLMNNKSISISASGLYAATDTESNLPEAMDIDFYSDISGNLSTGKEEQWYKFSTTKTSTIITIDLLMTSDVDFDLYVFQVSDDGSGLEMIGYSTNDELGAYEWVKGPLDARQYYICVNSVVGYGNFSMMVYGGTNDAKEINDTFDTASSYSNNSTMYATIDSPYDIDVYKASFSKAQLFKTSFTAPAGYAYEMVIYDGNSTFTLDNNELYNLPAGTYYFIVSTMDANQYSNTAKYYLNISACPKSNDSNIAGYWISGNWKSLFEFTLDRNSYYVNGNPIDFTYNRTIANVSVDLSLGSNGVVALFHEEALAMKGKLPDFINYRGSYTIGGSCTNALMLSLGNCHYRVNSRNSNINSLISNHSAVVINSNTGKIVDIVEPNPIYEANLATWYRIHGTTSSYDPDPEPEM